MGKIVFNTRDELVSVNADEIAVVQANGNYSRIVSIKKRETMVTMGITQVEEAMRAVKSRNSRFIRLGRSLVVNHSFLYKIEVLKQVITLSDGVNEVKIKVPRETLKSYKNAISKSIKIKNHETDSVRN